MENGCFIYYSVRYFSYYFISCVENDANNIICGQKFYLGTQLQKLWMNFYNQFHISLTGAMFCGKFPKKNECHIYIFFTHFFCYIYRSKKVHCMKSVSKIRYDMCMIIKKLCDSVCSFCGVKDFSDDFRGWKYEIKKCLMITICYNLLVSFHVIIYDFNLNL